MNKFILFFIAFMFPGISFSEGVDLKQVKTVSWFKDNQSEMKKVIELCNDNQGELGNNPNCINAQRAANAKVLEHRSFTDLEGVTYKNSK